MIRVNCVCPSFSPTGILKDIESSIGMEAITRQFGPLVAIDLVVDAFMKIVREPLNGT